MLFALCRSSHPEVFLGKGVLEICIKFTGEHPCRSASSIKLFYSPVNLLHIFRTHFPRNTSGQLLLIMSEKGFGQNQWPRSYSSMKEINFWTFWIFELRTFKVISFAMLAETIFFSAFLHSAQDLSHKIGKSWTLLIRVSISLIVEVHGVNGIGERAVMWVEPILLVSVTDSFLSPKVSTFHVPVLYNQCSGRSGIPTICSKSVFQKAIENIWKMYRTSVPAIRNFVLIFFILMTWQMPGTSGARWGTGT